MAAPTATARVVPTGFKMADGFKTTLAFSSKPAITLWERDVKPPSIDGGDGIDTTSMMNIRVRTKQPHKLYGFSDVSANCFYDPDVYADIKGMINVEQAITVWFPDGSNVAFWGFLNKFDVSDHKEGDPPMASINVCITNTDPTDRSEQEPVFTLAAGT